MIEPIKKGSETKTVVFNTNGIIVPQNFCVQKYLDGSIIGESELKNGSKYFATFTKEFVEVKEQSKNSEEAKEQTKNSEEAKDIDDKPKEAKKNAVNLVKANKKVVKASMTLLKSKPNGIIDETFTIKDYTGWIKESLKEYISENRDLFKH